MKYLIIFIIPLISGLLLRLLYRRKASSKVLLFHGIYSNRKFPKSLSEISESKFREICSMLNQNNTPSVPFSSYSDKHTAISIIFDDGLKSNVVASKILSDHNLNGTFFICSAPLNDEKLTDVYNQEMLNEEDIISISDKGFEIGSHTVHHCDLTLLNDDDLRNELLQSKLQLEEIIDKRVTSLSFPFGIWNYRIVKIAKEIGYTKFAVYNHTSKADLKEVFPVTGVYPFDTVNDVQNKLSGKHSLSQIKAWITPHFAKGSSLAARSSLYRKLPSPWFSHRKEKN